MFAPLRWMVAAALIASAAASPAFARRKAKSPPPPPLPPPLFSPERFAVERHVLDNGLVVLLHEDHTVPAITFWQIYRVGSRNERPGITGISHFFEHMMFNGSKNVPPKQYDRILESNGGASNAFTDLDVTAYFEDVASDRLDVVLELDSDRMASLSLAPEELASEIEVVKEERRLGTDNDVFGMGNELLFATAFLASPYRTPIVGWMGDLERIEREEMVDYFRTYYAPNNCVLVLTGDFDPAIALAKIRSRFEPIPRQKPPSEPVDSEPEQLGERRAQVHYPAEGPSFQEGYKAPGVKSPDIHALQVLAAVLSTGTSSRLHRALVYDAELALSARADFTLRLMPELFQFSVDLRPGKSLAEGEAALDSVLTRLSAEGPSSAELEKAKNQIEAEAVRALATNNGAGFQIGFNEVMFGDYHAMFDSVAKARAVTIDDCKRVARQVFDPAKRTVVEIVPGDEHGPETHP
ncbi:MAG: pitrilysin family protein [Acidobacteriota bacterium]